MTDPIEPLGDDDVLLGTLDDVLATVEPLRADLVGTVSAEAFALRNLDALVAQLVHDSALETSGVRSDDDVRTLSFSGEGVDVDVQLTSDDDVVRGMVHSPDATCELHTSAGIEPLSLDKFGRFEARITGARLRIVAILSGERIITPWIFR